MNKYFVVPNRVYGNLNKIQFMKLFHKNIKVILQNCDLTEIQKLYIYKNVMYFYNNYYDLIL